MTFGELKKLAELEGITDNFEIDIMGEHSGSFGKPTKIGKRIEPFPDGDYREFQIFIGA